MSEPAILTVVEVEGRIVCRLPRRYRWALFADYQRRFANFRKARYRWDRKTDDLEVFAPPHYRGRLREWVELMSGQFPIHVVDEDGVLALPAGEVTG